MKKRTHKEYVSELSIKNPTIKVIEEYVSISTPILHFCTIHNQEWSTTPSRMLKGMGCPKCRIDKYIQSRTKTSQNYIAEVKLINPDIIVIGQYSKAKTPILHKCKIDNYEWMASPSNILKGYGCPKCRDKKLSLQRAKTLEQYKKEVYDINPFIKVVGDYINADTNILHQCLVDKYEWMARPVNILNGKGCPKCAGNLLLTNAEYIDRLLKINPNVQPLEKYINANSKILHKCLIDGYVWRTTPGSILQGTGCPICAGNIKKDHSQYVQELYMINPDIIVVGQYIGSNKQILHRCKKDNFEWLASPTRLLSGGGCPLCQETNGERLVRQWLEKNNINYEYQKTFDGCKDKKRLPFDFYLPQYNMCIEFDGAQHFKPVDFAGKGEEWALKQFQKGKYHDDIKNQYCQNNNIRLLRISEIKNINEILHNYLLNIVM